MDFKISDFIKNTQNSSDGKIQSDKYNPRKCHDFNSKQNYNNKKLCCYSKPRLKWKDERAEGSKSSNSDESKHDSDK